MVWFGCTDFAVRRFRLGRIKDEQAQSTELNLALLVPCKLRAIDEDLRATTSTFPQHFVPMLRCSPDGWASHPVCSVHVSWDTCLALSLPVWVPYCEAQMFLQVQLRQTDPIRFGDFGRTAALSRCISRAGHAGRQSGPFA